MHTHGYWIWNRRADILRILANDWRTRLQLPPEQLKLYESLAPDVPF